MTPAHVRMGVEPGRDVLTFCGHCGVGIIDRAEVVCNVCPRCNRAVFTPGPAFAACAAIRLKERPPCV